MKNKYNFISEKDIEALIIKKLEKLKYIIDYKSKEKDVFLQNPKTEEERKILNLKKPDFIIYSDNRPIAIIEAKRPSQSLADALIQAEGYAKLLKVNIIFAFDGFKFVSKHIVHNKELYYGGTPITDFIEKKILINYINHYKINLEFGKTIKTESDFIKEMKSIENYLREEGLKKGDERFTEFSKLLFLKLISYTNNKSQIWNIISKSEQNILIDIINLKLKEINSEYKMDKYGEKLKINSPEIVNKIIKRLDKIDVINTALDVKGSAFEYLLNYKGKYDDLAQYFTPREIVRFMVELANPNLGEKIYDPFCGSGGILIKTFDYLKSQIFKGQKKKIDNLKYNTLYGTDISSIAYVAKMNMILAGDGHTNIIRQIDGSLVNKRTGQYQVVITNIPFSLNINSRESNFYNIYSKNGNSIAVQHCLDSLEKIPRKSRAVIVVPEQFIFSDELIETRKFILDNYDVKVFSLPQGVFLPYAIAKSCILFLQYKGEIGNFEFIEINDVGFEPNNKKTPTNNNDLLNYIKDEESVKKYKIDYNELRNNNYIFKPIFDLNKGVMLNEILELSKNSIELINENSYSEITVKNHGKGIIKRTYNKHKNIHVLKGIDIKSKRFVIKDEVFMYSTLDARNGGFGKIPKKLIGCVYSGTYCAFKLKKEYLNLNLNLLTKILSSDEMKKYFEKISNGTTNRRAVKKEDFLLTKLKYSKEKLFAINSKYNLIESKIDKMKDEFEELNSLLNNLL